MNETSALDGGRAIRALLAVTAAGVLIYWGAIFTGSITITSPIPGYAEWFMAFPLADLWIAAAAAASLVAWEKNPPLAQTLMITTGSAMIFLALDAFLYGYRTGLLFEQTIGETIEIAIKLYCFVVGASFIVKGYWRLNASSTAGF